MGMSARKLALAIMQPALAIKAKKGSRANAALAVTKPTPVTTKQLPTTTKPVTPVMAIMKPAQAVAKTKKGSRANAALAITKPTTKPATMTTKPELAMAIMRLGIMDKASDRPLKGGGAGKHVYCKCNVKVKAKIS